MSFNELGNPRSHLSTTPGKVRTFHFDIFIVIAVLALCGCFLLLQSLFLGCPSVGRNGRGVCVWRQMQGILIHRSQSLHFSQPQEYISTLSKIDDTD